MTLDERRAAAIAAREAANAVDKEYAEHIRTCRICDMYASRDCKKGLTLEQRILETTYAALLAIEAYAPTGTRVLYHGSQREHHGEWVVHGPTPGHLGAAYTLRRDDTTRVLSGVRIESITPIDEAPTHNDVREDCEL